MKNLVRGGVILSFLGLLAIFIIAQTRTENDLGTATSSHLQSNITESVNLSEKVLEAAGHNDKAALQDISKGREQKKENQAGETKTQDKDTKLVEKTVSSRAAGINKGKFTATAYCLRGRTASGAGVRKGIIAADPRVLRLGSRINLGAGAYSGDYVVLDTGSRIKGRRLDIWMASCAEARRFGRRSVAVTLMP